MPLSRASRVGCVLIALTFLQRLVAQDEPAPAVTLANPHGAAIAFTFSEPEGGWRWTDLTTPELPETPWAIRDRSVEMGTAGQQAVLTPGWALIESSPERLIFEQPVESLGLRVRRVYVFGTAANVLRIETWLRSEGGAKTVTFAGLLHLRIAGETFRETGGAPASFPLFGESLFAGIEHISGEARTAGDTVELAHRPRVAVDDKWQFVAAAVVGWVVPGSGNRLGGEARLREAFLQYLDTIRVKPERMVLHSETWWTLPPPLRENAVLNDIETLKKAFLDRTGMFFDTYCLDLGWSDPRTFWRIEPGRFPNEFRTVNERLGALGTKLGLWMSPGSGYPDGLDNTWLHSQGYEMTPFGAGLDHVPCFALGGRYQREFKERITAYAQQYGLGHVILDFMAHQCDVPTHGHPTGFESRYAIDAGVADVLDSLRAINPGIALEPMVCGYPPSPWWLMKTPFILGPAGDDMPYGRVPCPDWMESLISARDIAYRAGQEAWLMPTQALETWDIIVQTPGDFENVAVMAIGRGRWFISSYIKPDLMKPEDWDFFAALIRWARYNKQHLVNAWQFGGDPASREAYGYMFRNPSKDIYCVRNPWIEEQEIQLPGSKTAAGPRDVLMIYPRRATIGRIEAGQEGPRITLAPYETVMLETVPADDARVVRPLSSVAQPLPSDAPRRFVSGGVSHPSENESESRYLWGGTLSVPQGGAELCILVEGGGHVDRANCRVSVGGRDVTLRKTGSAGQFAAAIDVLPENWTWYLATLPAGETAVQIDLKVLSDDTGIGVYMRGTAPALNEPAPDNDAPVFPVFNAERRAWSQVVVPLATYPIHP